VHVDFQIQDYVHYCPSLGQCQQATHPFCSSSGGNREKPEILSSPRILGVAGLGKSTCVGHVGLVSLESSTKNTPALQVSPQELSDFRLRGRDAPRRLSNTATSKLPKSMSYFFPCSELFFLDGTLKLQKSTPRRIDKSSKSLDFGQWRWNTSQLDPLHCTHRQFDACVRQFDGAFHSCLTSGHHRRRDPFQSQHVEI
jgi:hypothetical protein